MTNWASVHGCTVFTIPVCSSFSPRSSVTTEKQGGKVGDPGPTGLSECPVKSLSYPKLCFPLCHFLPVWNSSGQGIIRGVADSPGSLSVLFSQGFQLEIQVPAARAALTKLVLSLAELSASALHPVVTCSSFPSLLGTSILFNCALHLLRGGTFLSSVLLCSQPLFSGGAENPVTSPPHQFQNPQATYVDSLTYSPSQKKKL